VRHGHPAAKQEFCRIMVRDWWRFSCWRAKRTKSTDGKCLRNNILVIKSKVTINVWSIELMWETGHKPNILTGKC